MPQCPKTHAASCLSSPPAAVQRGEMGTVRLFSTSGSSRRVQRARRKVLRSCSPPWQSVRAGPCSACLRLPLKLDEGDRSNQYHSAMAWSRMTRPCIGSHARTLYHHDEATREITRASICLYVARSLAVPQRFSARLTPAYRGPLGVSVRFGVPTEHPNQSGGDRGRTLRATRNRNSQDLLESRYTGCPSVHAVQ